MTAIHAFVSFSLAVISCISILSFTYRGFAIGLGGTTVCMLLNYGQIALRKKAFCVMDQYIRNYVIEDKV